VPICLGWKGPGPKAAHLQPRHAQTVAWVVSMLPLMPSCCVLLGSRAWRSVLLAFRSSAKAQLEAERFGAWAGAVQRHRWAEIWSATSAAQALEMFCCDPGDLGAISCQRSGTEPALRLSCKAAEGCCSVQQETWCWRPSP